MVSRQSWIAKYSLDKDHQYVLKSPVFIHFIDFDRSSLHDEKGDIITIPESVLDETKCVSPAIPDHEKMTPNGTAEDCWKTWNPYGDFTRVFAHILYQWKHSPKAFDIMFPDFALKIDVVNLLGDYRKNLFGRPSIDEIMSTVGEDVLRRTTPKMLFRRFAEQFINTPGEFSVMRTTSEIPYPSFGLEI
jgi:hypothetical protein